MKTAKEHIMHHAKRLVHHSSRIAHKHKHILLSYMHICLIIISLGIYHMATSMYAQENGETIIAETPIAITSSIENAPLEETTNTNEQPESTNETSTNTTEDIPLVDTGITLTDTGIIETNSGVTQEVTGSLELDTSTGNNLELTGTTEISGENLTISGEDSSLSGTSNEISVFSGVIETGDNTSTLDIQNTPQDTTGSSTQIIENPNDLSGLLVWLDASRYTSLSFTGDNLVTTWKDRRGFGNKAFVEDINKCPLYVTGVVNNHPALFFDDKDDGMETNINLTQPYTMFLLYNKEVTPTDYARVIQGLDNWFIGFNNDNFIYYASGQINKPYPRTNNTFKVVTITSNETQTQVFINNENISEYPEYTKDPLKLSLGAIGENQEPLGGYIAEIAIYDYLLSEDEINQINTYFIKKYYPFTSIGKPFSSIQNEPISESTGSTENSLPKQEPVNESGTNETQTNEITSKQKQTIEQDQKSELNINEISTTNEIPVIQESPQIQEIVSAIGGEPTITNITNSETSYESGTEEQTLTKEYRPANYFDNAYKVGESDEKINILQQLLTKLGMFSGSRSNVYDTTTLNAVYLFQKEEGLLIGNEHNQKIRGYMGPGTRTKLNEYLQQYSKQELENQESSEQINNQELLDESGIFSTLFLFDPITNPNFSTLFGSGSQTGTIAMTFDTIDEESIKDYLVSKGFSSENISLTQVPKNVLIGKENIDLSNKRGHLLIPIVLQSLATIKGNIAEVEIPEGTIFKTESGESYTGIIEAPSFYTGSEPSNLSGIENIASIKVGTNEHIQLEDENGNQLNATFRVPVPGMKEGDSLVIQYSQDGISWNQMDSVEVSLIDNEPYAIFEANHFTIFSLGAWTGSFSINNDTEVTTGLNVTLTSIVTGATHMRFGNTITERDAATWTGYKTGVNWTLSSTSGDGIKRVYAQFSGNGVIRNVSDSIIYDTTSTTQSSGLQLHLDGSFTGNIFYDLGPKNYTVNAIGGTLGTIRSGEKTIGFNGTNDINIATGIVTNYPFTISARVKPDRVTGTQGIVFRGASTASNVYYGINLNSSTFQITARNTTARTANGTIAAQIGKRYHVVGIFTSATSRTIYVNGVQGGTSTNSVTLSTTSPHRTVGEYAGTTTNNFSGMIDEVRVYNKALSASEIQSLYLVPPTFDPLTTANSTPILYGELPAKMMNVSLDIDGISYPTTGITENKWMTLPILTGLAAGTYDVTVNYTNVYGQIGSFVSTNGLVINTPSSTGLHINYTTTGWTNGNIISTLTGLDPTYMIVNNQGSEFYTFTGNGNFTYQYVDKVGTTGTITATVNNIDKIFPIFNGIISGTIYSGAIIINFNDTNLSGAILSGMNGTNYYSGNVQSGSKITTEGNFIFRVSDLAGNTTGASFSIQYNPEQRSTNTLTTLGYQTGTTTLTSLDTNTLIGNTNINFAGLSGNLLVPTLLQSSNTYGGQAGEVEIPAGAVLKNTNGTAFTGILDVPVFQTPSNYDTAIGKTVLSAIDVGSTKHIYFKDTGNNDMQVTFRMPTPGKTVGDLIDIYTSEDGLSFSYHTTVRVQNIGGNPYVVFESNHFSVVVTAGNNGTSVSADKAANSTSGAAYTTLGNIVIAEGSNTDFAASQTNATVILTAPTNRRFRAGSGTITYTANRDITAASVAVTSSTITITFTTDANANRADTITVSNIQVQAITGNILPSAGNIVRTSANPGTANIVGITNNVTNFGSLSQTFGSHKYLVITLPGQTFVAGSGNSGSALPQKTNSGFIIPSITAADQFYNIVTSYAGTKILSYTGAGGTPSYTTGVSFTAGQSTTTLNTTLTEAKTGVTLSVSDGTISGPISSPFTVYAAPTASVIYTPGSGVFTTGNVVATLTGFNKTGIVITNNSGSTSYTFTASGTFTFNLLDGEGYTGDVIANVNWIKNRLSYSTTGFSENTLNNGSVSGNIIVTLGTGSFSGAVANYITFANVPAGLTGTVSLSGTNKVILGLTGSATNHTAANSISNLSISFATGAFINLSPNDVIDSTKTGLFITFIDPYVGLQLYPSADTMLDADTNPADGCADGVCQENNYGTTDYLCASDFGSKILLKYDLSSIPVGSVITSAKIRLTKYYIGTLTPGTGFKMKQMINNAGWIEGTQNNAKALSGEPNYKMRKRGQETWYNGNIGLVAGIDYKSTDLITNPIFTGSLTADVTQEFTLNSNGIATLQDWHDDGSTNQGFVMSDADKDWICIHSKEYATVANRPLLTINYAPNTSIPKISNLNPANNESGVSLTNNLIITFDEKVKAYTGYTISIKRLNNSSVFATIGATSGNVTVNGNTVTIDPTNNFENYTGYYVEIQSGAFRDYAGNSFTGFAGSGTWKFTTINTASVPTVTGNSVNTITDYSAVFYGTLLTTGSSPVIERGFYRSTTSGFNDGAGTKISESGSWTTTGNFSGSATGLAAGTMIYFKAFARNTEGAGYTSQSGFLTKPGQPILLSASNIDNDAFKINWNTVTGATTYKLYVTTNSGWTTTLTGFNPKLLSGSLTTLTLTGLTRETTYYYKLVATNNAGDSIESTIGTATTLILPAPTARLKFEETAGNTAYDSTPNNNNGVIYGGTILNQSGADGKSFRFNGTGSDVSILDFNYGPSFTVSFWFKTSSTGDNIHLYSHGDDSAANSINVLLNYSDKTLRTYINGNQSILNLNSSTYATMTNNQWHYYVVTVEDNGIVPGKKNVIVYLDGVQKASDASVTSGSFDPINNITIGRRSMNQTGTYFSGWIDDVRIYDKRILSRDVNRIWTDIGSNIDTIAPTATISYNPGSGTCYSGNVTATLTGYSEPITITNNSGSNQYIFATNGSFVFQFQDAVGNTGSTTANVTWICKEPLSIGGPNMVTTGIQVADTLQMVEQRFPDYFWINDPVGANSGYYTTIGITNLSGAHSSISNNNIEFKANSIITLSGTTNSRVVFGSGLLNYQTLSSPLTYIKRDPAANSNVQGKYGDIPRLQIHINAYQQIDNYHATINYTLYEN